MLYVSKSTAHQPAPQSNKKVFLQLLGRLVKWAKRNKCDANKETAVETPESNYDYTAKFKNVRKKDWERVTGP